MVTKRKLDAQYNTIGKGSAHRAVNGGADCYFTPAPVAARLIAMALPHVSTTSKWIEPSAGAGVFLVAARAAGVRATGYDLTPRGRGIRKADWFDVVPAPGSVVFGNPPFGFSASMAVRFFQHAALSGASVIAFVVPGSFAKESVKRRLHPSYVLVEQEMQRIAFEFPDGGTKTVPCVLQVWTRLPDGQVRREPPADDGADLFIFTDRANANVAVRRVGGRAGQVLPSVAGSRSTTYFLRVGTSAVLRALQDAQQTLETVRDLTAGVRSVSKAELIAAVRAALNNEVTK
jgi:predicted RNA methylase